VWQRKQGQRVSATKIMASLVVTSFAEFNQKHNATNRKNAEQSWQTRTTRITLDKLKQ
jgi:hypothetical protein